MGLYVVIFLATWLGPLAHEVYQFYTSRWGGTRTYEIFFSYYKMIGVSSQGLANTCVWFTNPTFFLAIKEQYLKSRSQKEGAEGTNQKKGILEDERNDIQQLTLVLRKNMLTCILLAIRHCLDTLPDGKSRDFLEEQPIKKRDCTEIRHFIFQPSDPDYEKSETSPLLHQNGQLDVSNDKGSEAETFTSSSFAFYDISPRAFERIRALSGVNTDQYCQSLHPHRFLKHINDQKFTDGRSGSYFCFSPDKRFILKTVPHSESELLYNIMWDYYKHLLDNPDTLLLRFYGSYELKPPHAHSIYIVVFQNLFNTDSKIHEIYDLKGSWVNRGGGKENKHSLDPKEKKTGKDNDFTQIIQVGRPISQQFKSILKKDSEMLKRLNVMDYSLLVGIHYNGRESSSSFRKSNDLVTSEQELILGSKEPRSNITSEESDSDLLCQEDNYPYLQHQHIQTLPIPVREERHHHYSSFSRLNSEDGTKSYFMGVIDILQEWNFSKRFERWVKVLFKFEDGDGISAVNPEQYSDRFLSKISEMVQ
eukprot:TRINITY_DN3266_c0_g1_i5.p1 TRINITY_DN3266_c0_g1~~TRINITY_DN3266_c0_g1_i5.p1  ORF type:complete len:533 (-),score=95.29 TRINITY_DN3266_c0_g1_i5:22-1620(-)